MLVFGDDSWYLGPFEAMGWVGFFWGHGLTKQFCEFKNWPGVNIHGPRSGVGKGWGDASVVNCTRLSCCEKSLHSFRNESLSAKHPGIRFPPHKQCETPWVCCFTSISLFRLLQKPPTCGVWGLGPLLIRQHSRTKQQQQQQQRQQQRQQQQQQQK